MLSWLTRFLSSTIGRKLLMAVTGLGLVGFLVVHLAGNLTLYADDTGEAFTEYAEALHATQPLLGILEIGLLVLFLAHIGLGIRVSLANREARRQGYRVRSSLGERTFASSSMLITGVLVLVFLVVHVADFRFATLVGTESVETLADAVKARLRTPWGAGIYLVGVVALGIHLSHGFASAFQTLGANHPKYTPWIRMVGLGLALLLLLGFASFPIYGLLTMGQSGGAH